MDNFKPDANREHAIAAIMTAKNYVVITEQELDANHEHDGAGASYTFYYAGFMAAKGLMDYGKAAWKDHIHQMTNTEGE